MNTNIKKEIEAIADSNPTQEICGIIYHTLDAPNYINCKNVSSEPETSFRIDPHDFIRAHRSGKILSIYHSHPTKAGFSEEDIVGADKACLPILMYHVPTKTWNEYIPKSYVINLEGQPFIWGEIDCYGIVRAYLRQERGIYISDYDRAEGFADSGNNSILENFERENYVNIGVEGNLKPGDVLCFKFGRATNPHHLGVYLGNTYFLHHVLGKLSTKELLTHKFRDYLTHVFRHKNDVK